MWKAVLAEFFNEFFKQYNNVKTKKYFIRFEAAVHQ